MNVDSTMARRVPPQRGDEEAVKVTPISEVPALQAKLMTIAIVANGFADGPAQALRDYLVAEGSEVCTVFHPLTAEQGRAHVITRYAGGERVRERRVRLPLRPPASFALD